MPTLGGQSRSSLCLVKVGRESLSAASQRIAPIKQKTNDGTFGLPERMIGVVVETILVNEQCQATDGQDSFPTGGAFWQTLCQPQDRCGRVGVQVVPDEREITE